ncbi:hypothetical protein KKG29_02115 [Patescibacteria group bacterium]|nr:hypothetical protein [Patescibacteria group bacterium]MBU3999953.1 hypothetical protein [Patescibacteria group bacterium]MBU4057008.1 hypothetical protein [Patescibacteria group bacterium]MBU4368620.1 hypothetical protein [Patescibacteria group bacterium]
MSDKHRWQDPGNIGQPDYNKITGRVFLIFVALLFFAFVKIGIKNHWFDFIL